LLDRCLVRHRPYLRRGGLRPFHREQVNHLAPAQHRRGYHPTLAGRPDRRQRSQSRRDRHRTSEAQRRLENPVDRRKTIAQGAATSVLLAASPLLDGISGRYFEDCNQSPIVTERPNDFSGGVAPYALSHDNAARLWDIGVEFTALAR
jgi:hypothetical protein